MCGTSLDDSGYCIKCEVTPSPQDIVTHPRRGRRASRDDAVAVALRAPHRLLQPVVPPT
jgi:hypothetical protein